MLRLNEIQQGNHVELVTIPESHPLRKPLERMGIRSGSRVYCQYSSPQKDLVALEQDATVVALRRDELWDITARLLK